MDKEESTAQNATQPTTETNSREVIKAKVIYVLYYGAAASIVAYLPVYYKQLNMDETQTGILASLKPFVTFVGGPLWGGISDRTGRHKTVFVTAIVVYTLLIMAIYPFSLMDKSTSIPSANFTNSSMNVNQTTNMDCVILKECVTKGSTSRSSVSLSILSGNAKFWLLFLLTSIAFFFMSTISPILDATVVAMDTVDYGKLRLWGALGFGFFGFLSGLAANKGRLKAEVDNQADFLWSFIIFLTMNALMFMVCLTLKGVEGRRPSNLVLPHLKYLLTNPRVLLVIIVLLLMGICSGVITWFLFIFLKDLGGSQTLLGISIAVYCSSEVVIFSISDKMIVRLGYNKILFFSLMAFAVRLVAYSFLQNPWLVLPIELLHGITFAAMWAACVSYATSKSPPEVLTTVIGLMTGVHFGLGWGLGGALGGIVYQYYGARVLFRSCSVLCAVGMAVHTLAIALLKDPIPDGHIRLE